MSDRTVIAARVAWLHADLCRTRSGPEAMLRALDDVDRTLDHLRQTCREDAELVMRLGGPRAMAASYRRAIVHLAEAGVEPSHCADVLRRGRELVLEELAEVQRMLLSPEGLAAPVS